MFSWKRFGGYEVSSQGDRRFSAFNAILKDGRSIEQHYQCDIKLYQPGGTNWQLGKGLPPLDRSVNLLKEYTELWRVWTSDNLPLMRELYFLAKDHKYVLSDRFATSEVNQANALSIILNELVNK